MGALDCTIIPHYDASGALLRTCVVCPEVPAVAAVPASTVTDNRVGWNSGARSNDLLNGDVYTQFSVPPAVGVVCGFASERRGTDPREVSYGFYIYREAGREVWSVSEAGVLKTSPTGRDADVFRIERRNTVVRYFVNNQQVYVSATPTSAQLMVVACMYTAGDGVY